MRAENLKSDLIQIDEEPIISREGELVVFASVLSNDNGSSGYDVEVHDFPIQKRGIKIRLVVIESPIKNILQQMSYAVVGKYLCYRHNDDD